MPSLWIAEKQGDFTLHDCQNDMMELRGADYIIRNIPSVLRKKLTTFDHINVCVDETDQKGVYRFTGPLHANTTEMLDFGFVLDTDDDALFSIDLSAPAADAHEAGEQTLARGLKEQSKEGNPEPSSSDYLVIDQAADTAATIDAAMSPVEVADDENLQTGNFRPANAEINGVELSLYPNDEEMRILVANDLNQELTMAM